MPQGFFKPFTMALRIHDKGKQNPGGFKKAMAGKFKRHKEAFVWKRNHVP
jgi:hypothetical protein